MLNMTIIQPIVFSFIASATSFVPHVFPDGHVERTVAVVIRDRTLHVEYSVGMNDVTMQRMIESWKSRSQSEENGLTEDLLNGTSSDSTDDSSKESTPEPFDFELTENSQEEGFENDEKIAAEFKQLAVEHFAQRLFLKFGDNELELKPVGHPVPTKRHMSLTLEFEVKLPQSDPPAETSSSAPTRLDFVDHNFLNSTKSTPWHGAIRTSLKAIGGSMLVKSTAAPILVRAERVELTGQPAEKRKQAATISGVLILPND